MLTTINIFGGPGTGKSTTACLVFGEMKKRQISVELTTEYAKRLVYDESWSVMPDQIYIFAKQLRQYNRCIGKVDFLVNDAPLLMSIVYARYTGHHYQNFEPLVLETISEHSNINVYLERTVDYQTYGRVQSDIQEAMKIDGIVREVLDEYFPNVIRLPVDDNTVDSILELLPK